MKREIWAVLSIFLLASSCLAEHRFESGPYRGFTKQEHEQVIVELAKPFHVTEVSGLVRSAQNAPLHKVLFELRDDSTGKVKAAKTDAAGRFHLKHVKDGHYTFKVTYKGFQSVVGVFIVRAKTQQPDSVTIDMPKVL